MNRTVTVNSIPDGQVVTGDVPAHMLPAVWSGERQHELSVECWCQPKVETVAARIVHKAKAPDRVAGGF